MHEVFPHQHFTVFHLGSIPWQYENQIPIRITVYLCGGAELVRRYNNNIPGEIPPSGVWRINSLLILKIQSGILA
ncbi:hypothetical protein K7X08_018846 [Anisodus acutangulus]|uniref:Uncharacterized protein n=1 Tax=Anisodus acutangulus TaxID=402998 RepID=A0A9Q1LWG7_9SOLA|nr:hypothetical protein K7X08_018846 [Anisodus acutangulus]